MAGTVSDVSVVILTHNRADILEHSVRSALDQTHEEFELLVVDDASTDDTCHVIEAIDDDRTEYLQDDENRGAPAARTTGVAEALRRPGCTEECRMEVGPERGWSE